jgi:hypothetical protein
MSVKMIFEDNKHKVAIRLSNGHAETFLLHDGTIQEAKALASETVAAMNEAIRKAPSLVRTLDGIAEALRPHLTDILWRSN